VSTYEIPSRMSTYEIPGSQKRVNVFSFVAKPCFRD